MKKTLLLLILLIGLKSYSQKKSQDPLCATDEMINSLVIENAEFKNQLNMLDYEIANKKRDGLGRNSNETITIPIVVYVVHGGTTSLENISDNQVMSQINALNTYFSPYNINFCLATSVNGIDIPLQNATTNTSTTTGIIHVNNISATNHTNDMTGMLNLVNLAHPSITKDRYLRIWVVKSINGLNSNIAGYGTFSNSIPYIDGVVMDYKFFGDTSTCTGCNLQPSYNQGKILVHEVGHYLGLYHTFHEGCSGMDATRCNYDGDRVCDTPPVAGPSNCILGANTCSESPNLPDNIHNFMDYGVNACLYEFTEGQKERMLHYLETRRKNLYTNENIIYTQSCGYENLITAKFYADKYSICSNMSINFTSITQDNAEYFWDFGDGSTSTDPNPTHSYLSGINSPYIASLSVTNGGRTATYTELIFVTDCLPIQNSSTYWYVGRSKGLDFSSGIPVFDNSFPTNHDMSSFTGSFQNDQNGNLLYYNNYKTVWDGNHNQLNTVPLSGISEPHPIQSLSLPKPGNPSKSYIFTINRENGFRYSTVDINGTNLSMGLMNQPINFPSNNYLTTQDGAILGYSISAVENCNGYWIIATLTKNSGVYLAVYSLNSAITNDLAFVSEIKIPTHSSTLPNIEISPNGNKIFTYDLRSTGTYYQSFLFDFDKASGIISSPMEVIVAKRTGSVIGVSGASFSPDSQLLYLINNANFAIEQYNINTGNISKTQTEVGSQNDAYQNMQLGPDNKIYIATTGNKILTIHEPNNQVSPITPNACYYSEYGPVYSVYEIAPHARLPHIIDAKYETVYDMNNKISVYVAGSICNNYKFFPNVCGTSFKWEFKNLTTGNIVATSIENNPVYNFTISGDYLITLKNGANQFIASTNLTINGMTAPVIQGNSTTCITGGYGTSSNSVVLEEGSFATWSIVGGNGTISGFNNQADFTVNWTTLPGTISVTVTNANNCSTTVQKTITSSCILYGANNTVYTSSLQPNGKIIFGGDFTEYSGVARNRIARLNTDMTLDTSFSVGSGADNSVKATALQTDGRIIIGGTFTTYSGASRNGLARLNSNGSIDSGFTANLNNGGYINSIVIQSDGKIIVGGKFTSCNGTSIINIARLNSNGTVDPSFTSGFSSSQGNDVNCIAIQNNGKIVVGGAFGAYGGNNNAKKYMRLDSNGTLDSNFTLQDWPFMYNSNYPDPVVYSIIIQPDGKIFIGGLFTFLNNTIRGNIMRLNSNGAIDSSYGPIGFFNGFGKGVRSISLVNNQAVIGGGFTLNMSNRIAKLLINGGDMDPSFNTGTGFGSQTSSETIIHTLIAQNDGKIIAGGKFSTFNTIAVNNITRIDYLNPGSVNRPLPADDQNEDRNEVESEILFLENSFNENDFLFYPNPVKDVLNLFYTKNITNVIVYNLLGQKVFESIPNINTTEVDMSNLSSGSYLVKVTSDNQTKTIKVIKQ